MLEGDNLFLAAKAYDFIQESSPIQRKVKKSIKKYKAKAGANFEN